MLKSFLRLIFFFIPKYELKKVTFPSLLFDIPAGSSVGIIAGNGQFPLMFAKRAKAAGHFVYSVCHENESLKEIESCSDESIWIRVGELGRLIDFFKSKKVKYVVLAGGISRVKHFGDVKLDLKGTALLLRLRSSKDDVIMRGIAQELEAEGIEVIPCTCLFEDFITEEGNLTGDALTEEERGDIQVGISAIRAMSSEDIGQVVVVKEGVVVAVEAAEGTNEAIKRGGMLGKNRVVVVKCAKPTQDMRFDVPTAGLETIEICKASGVGVLALEAGRSIIIDKESFIREAQRSRIKVIGISSLV